MKSALMILRKFNILISFLRVRKIVAERHPNGTPKLMIRYRGAERHIREVSRVEVPFDCSQSK